MRVHAFHFSRMFFFFLPPFRRLSTNTLFFSFFCSPPAQGTSSSTSGGGEDVDITIDSVLTSDVKEVLEGYTEWEFDVWKVCFRLAHKTYNATAARFFFSLARARRRKTQKTDAPSTRTHTHTPTHTHTHTNRLPSWWIRGMGHWF